MYRQRQRVCPACDKPMSEVSVAVTGADEPARVDLCDRCGGVFLEYFDGEPGELSRGVLEQHLERKQDGVAAISAGCSCPDCEVPLSPVRYMGGPEISRCGSCHSIFASRSELQSLAAFRLPEEHEARGESLSLLARLRRLFFGDG